VSEIPRQRDTSLAFLHGVQEPHSEAGRQAGLYVAAYILCRPAAVIDQSGGGLHRHTIVLVWRPATAIPAEIDRTNERPDVRGFTQRDATPT
jgi:hypothetical protein